MAATASTARKAARATGRDSRSRITVSSSTGGTGPNCILGGLISSTTVRVGVLHRSFQPTQLPDLQREPEQGPGWVRFSQTVGGRAAIPTPRTVPRPPYVRHWVYDDQGRLTHKSGLTDSKAWTRDSFGSHTPWGDQDSETLVTAVETALERTLPGQLMYGTAKPRVENVRAGTALLRQGEPGTTVSLLLDGVVRVERDDQWLAEYGPGVVLGERAMLEGGIRTSTVTAVTPCRVASADATAFDRAALAELAGGHRRENEG